MADNNNKQAISVGCKRREAADVGQSPLWSPMCKRVFGFVYCDIDPNIKPLPGKWVSSNDEHNNESEDASERDRSNN